MLLVIAWGAAACGGHRSAHLATEQPESAATRTVEIRVTRKGFEPALIRAVKGEILTLSFTRAIERTCVTSVLVWLSEDVPTRKELPLNVPVSITLELGERGDVGYSCPMYMHGGRVHVE